MLPLGSFAQVMAEYYSEGYRDLYRFVSQTTRSNLQLTGGYRHKLPVNSVTNYPWMNSGIHRRLVDKFWRVKRHKLPVVF
jgi:hypothetical protein